MYIMYVHMYFCKLCNILEMKRTHIFNKCDIINKLYGYFSPSLVRLDTRNMSVKEYAFGIFEQGNKNTTLRNYITHTTIISYIEVVI